jgi:hypothetical protein
MVTNHLIPADITASYEVHEWRNATGVISTAHPSEWNDIVEMLRDFDFKRSEVLKGGGRKSVIAAHMDAFRAGLVCLNNFSASISGASAGVRLPSGVAAG